MIVRIFVYTFSLTKQLQKASLIVLRKVFFGNFVFVGVAVVCFFSFLEISVSSRGIFINMKHAWRPCCSGILILNVNISKVHCVNLIASKTQCVYINVRAKLRCYENTHRYNHDASLYTMFHSTKHVVKQTAMYQCYKLTHTRWNFILLFHDINIMYLLTGLGWLGAWPTSDTNSCSPRGDIITWLISRPRTESYLFQKRVFTMQQAVVDGTKSSKSF